MSSGQIDSSVVGFFTDIKALTGYNTKITPKHPINSLSFSVLLHLKF